MMSWEMKSEHWRVRRQVRIEGRSWISTGEAREVYETGERGKSGDMKSEKRGRKVKET